jgi:hypothetical protein
MPMARQLFTLGADGHMVPAVSEDQWRAWFADPEARTVAETSLESASITTTFMGLDCRCRLEGLGGPRALYFQTLAYTHAGDILGCAYAETRLAALAEHERLTTQLKGTT